MNVAKGLTLQDTYVLQEVSSGIECNDPLTESRDYGKEVSDSLAAQFSTTLDEKKADIWWKGTTPANKYLSTRKHSNGVNCFDIAVDGPEALVFTSHNDKGHLVRYWTGRNDNVSARIRHSNTPSYGPAWHLEVYVNQRESQGFRWVGRKVADHYVHRTITNESELTVAKYVAVYFARFS